MKKYRSAVGAALSVLLITGCTAAAGSSSLKRDVETLKAEVADLKDDGRLADLRDGAADPSEVARLRAQVQRLSANLNSSGEMAGQSLSQQLADISARLERLEKQAGLASPERTAANNGSAGPAATGGGYGGAYSPPGPDESSPAARTANLYEEGQTLFDQKLYREAVNRFKSYLVSEPKGANAAAAQFYIGEALYAQKQYEDAILEYQKVVQDFPKSNQIPTSLLKQGLSFQAIDQGDSAKLLYQKIVRDHPQSYAAGVARERLKTL